MCVFLESIERHAQDIGARQLIQEIIDPFLISSGRGSSVCLRLLDLDRGTLLVGHAARESSIGLSRQTGERKQKREQQKYQTRIHARRITTL